MALSNTELEYMALSKACAKIVWLCKLLQDLGFLQLEPTIIYLDNQSVIALSLNPKFHSKSKHIETQHQCTRKLYNQAKYNSSTFQQMKWLQIFLPKVYQIRHTIISYMVLGCKLMILSLQQSFHCYVEVQIQVVLIL